VLALAAVGVVPVLVLGVLSYGVNREELLGTVSRAQERYAVEAGRSCERFVLDRVQSLQLSASYIPFERLTRAEIGSVLSLPYRQLPEVNILALLDRSGVAVAPPVYEGEPERDPDLKGHEGVGEPELDAFSRGVPVAAALAARAAVGPPYLAPRTGVPRVAVAFRVGAERVLAAELSLAALERQLRESAGDDGLSYLVDGKGRILATTGDEAEQLAADEQALVREGAHSAQPITRIVRRGDPGQPWLASYARVGELGWGVVVTQPTAVAFRAAVRVRTYTLFWAAAAGVLTLALGTFLARDLAGPVRRLSEAAAALKAGRYDAPVPEGGADELGQLATAFRHMTVEVRRRDEEIRAWNAELQQRVEEKTAELRAAQEQISRSRRLAAMGSLGAGVAHGLNNPMTSIVGLVQMAREEVGAESSAGEMLGTALDEARRVTRIVRELRDLADQERNGGGVQFSLATPVQAVLERRRDELEKHRIELHAELSPDLPPIQGDPRQIEKVIEHLVVNAIAAMAEGGRLEISLSGIERDAVKLRVADTGRGIPDEIRDRIFDPFFTTSQQAGDGLGLSISNGIVEAHHGRILVDSVEGKGACFTVLLPAAPRAVHLA
jgi:signal transduction histidine kinase